MCLIFNSKLKYCSGRDLVLMLLKSRKSIEKDFPKSISTLHLQTFSSYNTDLIHRVIAGITIYIYLYWNLLVWRVNFMNRKLNFRHKHYLMDSEYVVKKVTVIHLHTRPLCRKKLNDPPTIFFHIFVYNFCFLNYISKDQPLACSIQKCSRAIH